MATLHYRKHLNQKEYDTLEILKEKGTRTQTRSIFWDLYPMAFKVSKSRRNKP